MKGLIVAALVVVVGVWGIKKEDFPNPIHSPAQCWKYNQDTKIPANLKVCDPDGLLLPEDGESIK